MIIISDNSALSCLAELGELDLLRQLYGTITVTATVREEGCHPHAPEALRKFYERPPAWLVIVPDVHPNLDETGALDPGEASAISLAWQHRDTCLLIIDEKQGRKVCNALGLHITGAAGLLCDAASAGLIDFDDAFARLTHTRFRLSARVMDVLRQRHQSDSPMEL